MAFNAAFENGPAARSFAADAYDCIMVRIPTDLPNTRLRRVEVLPPWQAPLGSLVAPWPDVDSVPPCSRPSRSGLEALEQAVPAECRPSLTAARHDGEGLPSRKASMGTLTYPFLTEIYAAAICAPFQDWPSRNTALRITMSFRMTAVTTYLKG